MVEAMMPEQSSAHFYLNWTKERIDEMDATLASLEAKASQVQAGSKAKAEQLIADLKKRRDEFQAIAKKQAEAGEVAGWLLTGLPIFLGSVDVLAPCPGATGARGAAWVPTSLSATWSSCFDTICSLSTFADRSCATLTDCGSPALAGTIFVGVELSAVMTGGGGGELGLP
jgi:hypothetical protein